MQKNIHSLQASMSLKYFTSLSKSLLTFRKNCGLPSDLFKPSDNLLTPVHKTV